MLNLNQPLTGMSLSFCISDICRGLVTEASVTKIIASTNASTREEFVSLLDNHYCKTYWRDFPQQARELALRLYDAGKIDQPRTRNEGYYMINHGHWMDSSEKIVQVR